MAPEQSPALNWCVELATPHHRQTDILSAEAAHTAEGMAALKWQKVLSYFSRLSLCLLDPHQKSSCTEQCQPFPFHRFSVTSGSDLWLSLSALISPKEKTILQEQNKTLLDVRNQYSLLQVEIIVWGSLISNRCRTQTTAPAHSPRSSHALIVSLDATAICLLKLVLKCVRKNKKET